MITCLQLFIPLRVVLLNITLLKHVIRFFRTSAATCSVIGISSVVTCIITVLTYIFVDFVFSVIQFCHGVFAKRKCLAVALPVAAGRRLLIGILATTLFRVVGIIAVFLSLYLVATKSIVIRVFHTVNCLLTQFTTRVNNRFCVCVTRKVLLLLITLLANFLLCCAYVTIKRLFGGGHVLTTINICFTCCATARVLNAVLIILFSILCSCLPVRTVIQFTRRGPRTAVRVILYKLLLFCTILKIICFLVAHCVIGHHLGLRWKKYAVGRVGQLVTLMITILLVYSLDNYHALSSVHRGRTF